MSKRMFRLRKEKLHAFKCYFTYTYTRGGGDNSYRLKCKLLIYYIREEIMLKNRGDCRHSQLLKVDYFFPHRNYSYSG